MWTRIIAVATLPRDTHCTLLIVPWDITGVSCEVPRNYGSCSHSSRGEAQFASKALLIMMLCPQSDLYYILDQRMLGKIIASLETCKLFSKCSYKSIWYITHAYLSLSLSFQVFKEKDIFRTIWTPCIEHCQRHNGSKTESLNIIEFSLPIDEFRSNFNSILFGKRARDTFNK